MQFVFLVADGMGDWPVESLGNKTPLEYARTPHMDALAARGIVGTARTVPESMEPGSDVANMSLLGFDPAALHTGRGPIEAAAQGIASAPDDVIFRLNLVAVDGFGPDAVMRDYSAGHIETEAARPVVEELQRRLGGTYEFVPGVQYRHLLVRKRGAATADARLAVRPPHDILDQPIAPDWEEFAKSPELFDLVRAAAAALEEMDSGAANAVWPWGQGGPLALPAFADAFGLSGAVISAVDLIKGLGRAAGMEVIDVPGATGLLDTNYEGKVAAALDWLERGGDFVFVHLEGPDECGHSGVAADKVEAIERFDARVVAPLVETLGESAAFLVTCDHYTPLAIRTHHGSPVPFALAWPGCGAPSGVRAFTEAEAEASGLNVEPGHDLLRFCLERIRG